MKKIWVLAMFVFLSITLFCDPTAFGRDKVRKQNEREPSISYCPEQVFTKYRLDSITLKILQGSSDGKSYDPAFAAMIRLKPHEAERYKRLKKSYFWEKDEYEKVAIQKSEQIRFVKLISEMFLEKKYPIQYKRTYTGWFLAYQEPVMLSIDIHHHDSETESIIINTARSWEGFLVEFSPKFLELTDLTIKDGWLPSYE